jgi:hypothetical protein
MNFLPGRIVGNGIVAAILAEPLPIPAGLPKEAKIVVGIRPESIEMRDERRGAAVAGVLCEHAIGIGGRYLARVALGDVAVKVKTDGRPAAPLGATVYLEAPRERIVLFADGQRVTS